LVQVLATDGSITRGETIGRVGVKAKGPPVREGINGWEGEVEYGVYRVGVPLKKSKLKKKSFNTLGKGTGGTRGNFIEAFPPRCRQLVQDLGGEAFMWETCWKAPHRRSEPGGGKKCKKRSEVFTGKY